MEDTRERIYHGNVFAETRHGLLLIRGENVVLLGEIVRVFRDIMLCVSTAELQDLDEEDDVPLREVDYQELDPIHKADSAAKKHQDELKAEVLHAQKGFCREGGEGDGY